MQAKRNFNEIWQIYFLTLEQWNNIYMKKVKMLTNSSSCKRFVNIFIFLSIGVPMKETAATRMSALEILYSTLGMFILVNCNLTTGEFLVNRDFSEWLQGSSLTQ